MPVRLITDPEELAAPHRQPREDMEIWFRDGAPSGLFPDSETPPSPPDQEMLNPSSAPPDQSGASGVLTTDPAQANPGPGQSDLSPVGRAHLDHPDE
jgi:hypothetical protein